MDDIFSDNSFTVTITNSSDVDVAQALEIDGIAFRKLIEPDTLLVKNRCIITPATKYAKVVIPVKGGIQNRPGEL